jgi:hypothetical protein
MDEELSQNRKQTCVSAEKMAQQWRHVVKDIKGDRPGGLYGSEKTEEAD